MHAPATEGDRGARAIRVLIVDDHEDTARSMRALLKIQGYDTSVAFDGPRAIEVAGRFLPDVVLLDLTLPGMSGEEVARELRRSEDLAGTAIVAVSGYDADRLPAGFDAHFVKPVDHEALNRYLAEAAGRREPGPAPG